MTKLSRPLAGSIGTFQSLNDLVANPSGLAIFLCPPFGQPFGVGHFFMSAAAPPPRRRLAFDASSLAAVRAMQCFRRGFKTDARRQFSSSGARDVVRDC